MQSPVLDRQEGWGQGASLKLGENLQELLQAFVLAGQWQSSMNSALRSPGIGGYDAQIGWKVTSQYAMVLVGSFGINGEREKTLTSR